MACNKITAANRQINSTVLLSSNKSAADTYVWLYEVDGHQPLLLLHPHLAAAAALLATCCSAAAM
jgi:hypothetical protein